MDIKLKICPFCDEPDIEIVRYGNRRVSTQYQCNSCGCFLETGEEWDYGRAWNRRPAEERYENLIMELVTIIEFLLPLSSSGKDASFSD